MQKPIQYSADELKVGEEIQKERAERAAAEAAEAQAQAQAAAAAKAAETKAALKALMDRIPTTKDAVWSYPVQWSAYNPAMGDRFRCVVAVPWFAHNAAKGNRCSWVRHDLTPAHET
eukprot:scaffold218973_cov21-Tisochrysis_lutea.AAC.2